MFFTLNKHLTTSDVLQTVLPKQQTKELVELIKSYSLEIKKKSVVF